MTFYLTRGKVSQDTMDALVQKPQDRLITMTRVLHDIGGRLHYYFFCFGDYDIVLIYELSDNVSAAALAMALTASGSVTEVDTTVLLTMEEAIGAMKVAGEATGAYAPAWKSDS
jgi:uncharacterized protein with GYD domain